MLYGKYTFACRFTSNASLPEFKGSTLRGVFGRALKKVVCVLKRQECTACMLNAACLYPQIFEPDLIHSSETGDNKASSPHPFVLEPPISMETDFRKGDHLDFNLLLFGQTTLKLPYLVYAFDEIGHMGIGKKINGRRGTFCLESVRAGSHTIYSGTERKLQQIRRPGELKLEKSGAPSSDPHMLTFNFQTPLRLKHNNQLTPELPFHVLVRAMTRRASTLLNAFGEGEPPLDYSGMVQRAHGITTAACSLTWADWRRYSFRQEQAMLLGGLMGSIAYQGDLEEYLPLIDFCARVHLGKQTTFGLGRFTVEAAR